MLLKAFRPYAIGALVLVLSAPSVASPLPQDPADEHMRRGLDLIQSGQSAEALAAFQQAIEASPQLASAHYYAGMALGQLQRFEEGLAAFLAAAELDPGNAQIHVMALRTAYSLQDYDEAWNQGILAALAGFDTTEAFAGLEQVAPRPADFEARMSLPRVFVAELDLSRLNAVGATPDTESTGSTTIAAGMADFVQIRRQLGLALARSEGFGVTQNVAQATHVVLVEMNDGAGGLLKLIDTSNDETVASRPVTFSSSESALRGEADRLVGFLATQLQNR